MRATGGWADDEYAYVLPDVVFKQVASAFSAVGDKPFTRQVLEDLFIRLGWLIPNADGCVTTTILVEGRKCEVYKIPLRLWPEK